MREIKVNVKNYILAAWEMKYDQKNKLSEILGADNDLIDIFKIAEMLQKEYHVNNGINVYTMEE